MSARPVVPQVVTAALEAANAHDTDAWLKTFAADGAVDDWGRIFTGHDAMRAWSDAEFIGVKVTLQVTGTSVQDDTVTVAARVGGNGFNGPSHFAFTIRDDSITLMRITS